MQYATFGSFDEFMDAFTGDGNRMRLSIGMYSDNQAKEMSGILSEYDIKWLWHNWPENRRSLTENPITNRCFVSYDMSYSRVQGGYIYGLVKRGQRGRVVMAKHLIALFKERNAINVDAINISKIIAL